MSATKTRESIKESVITSIAPRSSQTEEELLNEAVSFLTRAAKRRKLNATFHTDRVRYSEMGLIILPATLSSDEQELRKSVKVRVALEDSWNWKTPAPARRIHLDYLWNPEISLRSTPPPLNQNV